MLDFERLDVYQCSIAYLSLVFAWIPKVKRGNGPLIDQWRRAAMAIPLNIGEGAGKTSAAERMHCYQIARGEAMECGAITDVVRLLQVVPGDEIDRGKQLLVRVVEMLSRMAR